MEFLLQTVLQFKKFFFTLPSWFQSHTFRRLLSCLSKKLLNCVLVGLLWNYFLGKRLIFFKWINTKRFYLFFNSPFFSCFLLKSLFINCVKLIHFFFFEDCWIAFVVKRCFLQCKTETFPQKAMQNILELLYLLSFHKCNITNLNWCITIFHSRDNYKAGSMCPKRWASQLFSISNIKVRVTCQ